MNLNDILFNILEGPYGQLGLITLNRPQFLNALTQEMCIDLDRQLTVWEKTADIKAVVIRAAGDRAFCAGGDIRSLYALRDQPIPEQTFFWHEYRMNRRIYHFPKPYIALLDGLTMGGGAGISINGSFRIASEKLKLAMPETGIGFFPDVGGSYFLPRCTGKIGWYLGLTAQVINPADACHAGLIHSQVPSQAMPGLIEALTKARWSIDPHTVVKNVISEVAVAPGVAELAQHQAGIDHCFAVSDIEEILKRLREQADSWADEVVKLLLTRSPTSLKVVCEQLRRGAQLSFDECSQMEYSIALRFLRTPDFYEGVRAAVIDKDRSPRWNPPDLASVQKSAVLAFF